MATSVVAHVFTDVASTSRLRSSSSERAPYLILVIRLLSSGRSAEAGKGGALLSFGWQALGWQRDGHVGDPRPELVGQRPQRVDVEPVRAGRVVGEHDLHLARVDRREAGPQRL